MRRIYLDTSVIIDLLEKNGAVPELLRQLIVNPEAQAVVRITSELTLAEALVRPILGLTTGTPDLDPAKAYQLNEWYHSNLVSDGSIVRTVPISRDILIRAALVRAQLKSVKLPDAIHVATALDEKCSHFVVGDERLFRALAGSSHWTTPPKPALVFAREIELGQFLEEITA